MNAKTIAATLLLLAATTIAAAQPTPIVDAHPTDTGYCATTIVDPATTCINSSLLASHLPPLSLAPSAPMPTIDQPCQPPPVGEWRIVGSTTCTNVTVEPPGRVTVDGGLLVLDDAILLLVDALQVIHGGSLYANASHVEGAGIHAARDSHLHLNASTLRHVSVDYGNGTIHDATVTDSTVYVMGGTFTNSTLHESRVEAHAGIVAGNHFDAATVRTCLAVANPDATVQGNHLHGGCLP